MITYDCPHCGKHLKIPDEYAGKQGKCAGCRSLFTVPRSSPPPLPSSDLFKRLETMDIDPDRVTTPALAAEGEGECAEVYEEEYEEDEVSAVQQYEGEGWLSCYLQAVFGGLILGGPTLVVYAKYGQHVATGILGFLSLVALSASWEPARQGRTPLRGFLAFNLCIPVFLVSAIVTSRILIAVLRVIGL